MPEEHKSYKCKECGKKRTLWVETIAYKEKLCPQCLDKKYSTTDLLKRVIEEEKKDKDNV